MGKDRTGLESRDAARGGSSLGGGEPGRRRSGTARWCWGGQLSVPSRGPLGVARRRGPLVLARPAVGAEPGPAGGGAARWGGTAVTRSAGGGAAAARPAGGEKHERN
jgi:hypothetical protein